MMSYRPHNVPFVALGAALLWFGWFGFNAGSEFVADGVAGLALINTVVASGAALVSWIIVERVKVGKPTLVGAATGLGRRPGSSSPRLRASSSPGPRSSWA